MVTPCHSLPFVATRCHSLYHLLSLVVTRCHSLSLVVPLVVSRCTTRCHSLSLLVVIRRHSLYHSFSLVVTRCTTRRSFYKRSSLSIYLFILFFNFLLIQNWLPFVCWKLQCHENLIDRRKRNRIIMKPGVRVLSCFEKIERYCLLFFRQIILIQTIFLINIPIFYHFSLLERWL